MDITLVAIKVVFVPKELALMMKLMVGKPQKTEVDIRKMVLNGEMEINRVRKIVKTRELQDQGLGHQKPPL